MTSPYFLVAGAILLERWDGKIEKRIGTKLSAQHSSFHFEGHLAESADPGLRQGRGGAWDHRRCRTFARLHGSFDHALRPQPSVAASTRHSGHSPLLLRAFKGVQACRLPGVKPLQPRVATSTRHSGHSPLLLRAFKPTVCWKPLVQTCRLPGSALCS